MNDIEKLMSMIKEEFGDNVDIKVIAISPKNEKDEEKDILNLCYEELERLSPSKEFEVELSNVLATFENFVKSAKEYSALPIEEYIDDLNKLLNEILESSNYSIEIKLK